MSMPQVGDKIGTFGIVVAKKWRRVPHSRLDLAEQGKTMSVCDIQVDPYGQLKAMGPVFAIVNYNGHPLETDLTWEAANKKMNHDPNYAGNINVDIKRMDQIKVAV